MKRPRPLPNNRRRRRATIGRGASAAEPLGDPAPTCFSSSAAVDDDATLPATEPSN